jgi:hypothetical protein
MSIDDNKTLGVLCRKGHEYKNTGKSLRYKKNGDCILCVKMRQEKRKKKPVDRLEKERAREYAALHCLKYRECRDKAAYAKWGGCQMNCHQCEKMEIKRDCYLDEVSMGGCCPCYDEITEYRIIW